jgi:fucose 4-O-acetylase-like acetyltransferase
MSNSSTSRVAFLDRIRVILTALVILHHSAIMFGAPGGWYLRMPTPLLAEKVPFTLFVSINQSFFMGFFFLLAGYFGALSYDRKGSAHFVRDRVLRLGLPILVYGFFIGPVTVALAGIHAGQPFLEHWAELTRHGYFNMGPLWFAYALLLFSFAYLLWRQLDKSPLSPSRSLPVHGALLAAALATGAAAFVLRLWVPVGHEVWSLQIGYFASYVVLFAAGCAAARYRWLERIDASTARPWRLICILTIPLLFVYGVLAGAARGVPFDTSGGLTLPALAYAFWEPFVAWGIILGMLWRGRVAPQPSPRYERWAPRAYTAFIIHPPVVVAFGLLLANQPLLNSAKFVVAGIGSVVLCFLLAQPLLRIPGARRVL